MVDDTKPFWNRLIESQILDAADCAALKESFQSNESQDNSNPENLAHWLCQQKAISKFQADILLQDCPGPFKFGNYLVVDRLAGRPETARFLGSHTTTGHPVLIEFVAGSEPSALQRWTLTRLVADRLAQSPHPNLLPIFESVAIPQYRFVVSAVPDGQPLVDRVPLKTRLPWENGNRIIGQAASILAHLKDRNIDRIRLFHDSLWIGNSGHLQLMYPFDLLAANGEIEDSANHHATAKPDSNQSELGELWYRLLTGRTFDTDLDTKVMGVQEIKRLQKFGVPDESIQMIRSLIAPDGSNRPDAESIVEHCQRMARWDGPPAPSKKIATLAEYESWLARSPQSINSNRIGEVDSSDFQFGDEPDSSSMLTDVPVGITASKSSELISENPVSNHSRKSRYSLAASLAGSVMAIGSLIAVVVALTTNRSNETARHEGNNTDTARPETEFQKPDLSTAGDVAITKSAEKDKSGGAGSIEQILISDDGQSLWETPTDGPPINFQLVPPAPKLAFVVRPAELCSHAEGRRLIQALGPALNGRIATWQQQVGFSLDEIERILITLHSGEDFSYEAFFIVDAPNSLSTEELLQLWGNPELLETAGGENYYADGPERAYRIVDSTPDGATRFVFGPQWLVADSLNLAGADPLAGSIKSLASWSDSHRYATLLFLRSGLFDDAGQKLMSGSMAKLNRELSLALDANIRGGLLSLHLDHGTYLELRLDRTDDLRAPDLEQSVADLLEQLPISTIEFSNRLNASSHWSNTKNRFAIMIADFSRRWRIGSEDKQFIANCWLPPTAAHNLVASMELMLAFANQPNPDDKAGLDVVPQTLEELLAAPRDLAVSTSPDLIILINNLQQEIRDDYGNLPFDFEIRLMGNDLSREGITQNQRPGSFEIKLQPLSDILTEIMVKANPDKNITGASDVNCKMVWVVAADPTDPDRKIVLITTRSAATENSYSLPPAFIGN